MKPPRPSPAKIMPGSAAAAEVSASRAVEVHRTCTPWNRHTCSATRVVVTGRATVPPRRSAATRSSTTSSARSSLTSWPISSTSRTRSPTGSNRTPNAAREEPTSSARRCRSRRRSARVSVGAASSSRLLTVSTSTPDPAEQGWAARARRCRRRSPPRPSSRPRAPRSCPRSAAARRRTSPPPAAGTAARRSRRGTRAGTPGGRRPAPACAGRPGTGRRRGRRGTRCPRSAGRRGWCAARRRRRRSRAAVWNRATGSGAASRSSTLIAPAVSALITARFSARAAREVSRRGDDRVALPQHGGVGAGEPYAVLGGDLDVDQAGDAARAEQAALAAGLPDHAGVHHRAGLDGLERVDLAPRWRRTPPPRSRTRRRRPRPPRSGRRVITSVFLPITQPRRLAPRADVDVVVDHRAVHERAALRPPRCCRARCTRAARPRPPPWRSRRCRAGP